MYSKLLCIEMSSPLPHLTTGCTLGRTSGSVMDAPEQGQELLISLCYVQRNTGPLVGV